MKRFLKLTSLLLSALLFLSLTACGGRDDDPSDTGTQTSAEFTKSDPATAAATEPVTEPATEDEPLTRPDDDAPLTREDTTEAPEPIDITTTNTVEIFLLWAEGKLPAEQTAAMESSLAEEGARFVRNDDGTASIVDDEGMNMRIGQWPTTGAMASYPKPTSGKVGLWTSESGQDMVIMAWTVADAKAYAQQLKGLGFTTVIGEVEDGTEYTFMAMNAEGLVAMAAASAVAFENTIMIGNLE